MQRIPLTIEQQNTLKSIAWLMVALIGACVIGLGTIFTCLFIASGNAPIVRVFIIVGLTITLVSLGFVAWRVYLRGRIDRDELRARLLAYGRIFRF